VHVAELAALGLTRAQIRAAVDSGTLARVRHAVVAVAGPTTDAAGERDLHLDACRAALHVLDDASVVSHQSAAALHGLPWATSADRPGDVVVTSASHGRIATGIHRRLGEVPRVDLDLVEGVPCTGVARTALDLSRRRPLNQSLVVLDAACARVGRPALWAAYDRLVWVRDRRALHVAITRADPRSESPLESSSRGFMLRSRLPEPELQVWIVDRSLRRHRVDFLWRDRMVVGEADGWGKYADLDVLREEKRREDALRDLGFVVVRWTSDELWRTPDLVMGRLRRALS
jgi:very-short-patch-repair endonuclease